MRLRNIPQEDEASVPLSPLIDCVFLLLIFFLVTTMIKRWEKQIPITMPDITSSLSDDANEDLYRIAMDVQGKIYHEAGRDADGFIQYSPIPGDLAGFLKQLSLDRKPERPLRILAHQQARFQSVIHALDICQLQGFTNVDLKLNSHLPLHKQ